MEGRTLALALVVGDADECCHPRPQGLIRMQVVQAEQAKSPVTGEQRKGVPLPR